MSKALELIETWEETLDFGSDIKMWAHVDLMVDELRRLAEIERKYNEIKAQEPVGFISEQGDLYDMNTVFESGDQYVYTLKKD